MRTSSRRTLSHLEDHLLHCLREQGYQLNQKAEKDIRLTMRAAHRLAFDGCAKRLPRGQYIQY